MKARTKLWTLVLAGGDGTRLQEFTRSIAGSPIPKQYCRITGRRSLLESTLARIRSLAPPARSAVIVNHAHLGIARPQLEGVPSANVLVQPENRDTGPGLVFALTSLASRCPDATLAVFPSDHYVGDGDAFRAHVVRAARIVDAFPEKVAVLGIRPDRPEPGYGYLEPGCPVADDGPAFHVTAFVEKPTPEVAGRVLARGGLWNSFVMVFRIDRMLALLRRVRRRDCELVVDAGRSRTAHEAYAALPRWNFSSGFLARIPEHLVAVRVEDVDWSDWGTPEAIARTFARMKRKPPWGVATVKSAVA